ncbi:hypothetical protein SCACP_28170 [Sporomusa carbonis]|uniref:hypothetical protein n=1 Tax=Sporomusa carbonis TaxID=3076075 RepID=UPI003A60E142
MDNLVIQAYEKADTKNLYAITRILELLLKRRYTTVDPRFQITTRQVECILRNNGLTYSIGG